MSQTNRRQFLKTTAVGAGIAVGTGSGYAGDEPQFSPSSSVVKTFTATAGEGYIAIDADNPQGDGSTIGRVDFAGEQIGGDVTISGEVYDDNTWQSTSVDFPPIDIKDFLSEDTFSDLPIDIGLDDITADIDVIVDTITGQFDAAQGLMTAEPFSITVDADATVDAGITSVNAKIEVSASAPLTTGQSGELQGSAQGLDTTSANVTLVSNNFIVPATGETISVPVIDDINIDDQVGLPADDKSRNYLELELDMDLAEVFGFVEGTVTGPDGIAESGVEVTASSSGGTATAVTDDDGQYRLSLSPGSYGVTFDKPGFKQATNELTVEEDVTKTVDITLTTVDAGTVRGSVVDVDGAPISGIEVVVTNTVTGETVATVMTDETGTYETQISVGEIHKVAASDPNYGQDSQKVSVQTDGVVRNLDPLELGEPPDSTMLFGGVSNVPREVDDPDNGVIAVTDPQTGEIITEVPASNGSFSVSLPPGEYGIAFSAEGFRDFADTVTVPENRETVQFDIPVEVDLPPVVGSHKPGDIDGDQQYESVRGNGEFTILDVQALFNNLDNPAVQDNYWAYKFSNDGSQQVNILDVQSLFNKLTNQ
jgi:hypothetical protein